MAKIPEKLRRGLERVTPLVTDPKNRVYAGGLLVMAGPLLIVGEDLVGSPHVDPRAVLASMAIGDIIVCEAAIRTLRRPRR